MKFYDPRATPLEDHKPNFQGTTYRVEKEGEKAKIIRTDKEDDPVISEIEGEGSFKKARTRAQVLAKRNSNSSTEAIVRVPENSETLGFGGKYEEMKKTPTPEEYLEELKDEDASIPNPDIEVSDQVQETLEKLVEQHNEEVEKESRKANIGQLKSVYSRGRGAFTQTSRPSVDSATQWALARVKNAYLPLLKEGEPPNDDYVQDNDLLPPGHPKSSRQMEDEQATLGEDKEEDKQLIDNRRDKTSKKEEKEDKDKAEFVKKAETLEPYQDDQDNLDNFSDYGREEAEALMDEVNATDVLEKFKELTELSPGQLEKWKEDECHTKASGDDADKHIERNKFLLEEATDQLSLISKKVPEDLAMESAKKHIPEDRDLSHRLAVFQMMRTNSFLARMYGTAEEHDLDPIPENLECPSELEIALRNWAGSLIEDPRI